MHTRRNESPKYSDDIRITGRIQSDCEILPLSRGIILARDHCEVAASSLTLSYVIGSAPTFKTDTEVSYEEPAVLTVMLIGFIKEEAESWNQADEEFILPRQVLLVAFGQLNYVKENTILR